MDELQTPEVEALRHRGDELHLLREVFRTNQVLLAEFTRKTGMTASCFALLRLLALSPGDAGVSSLARQLGVNSAAVTRRLQELESERLVTRRADERDGRRSKVKLSAKGKKLFAEIHERLHELERSLASVIGDEELRAAALVLSKLCAFLEERRG